MEQDSYYVNVISQEDKLMALTVTGYTQRDSCDVAGNWSAGVAEADLHAEGAGCLKIKVSNTTSAIVKCDFTSVDLSGLHLALYLFVAGTWNLKANGGVCL